jgi:hypothetical protein
MRCPESHQADTGDGKTASRAADSIQTIGRFPARANLINPPSATIARRSDFVQGDQPPSFLPAAGPNRNAVLHES